MYKEKRTHPKLPELNYDQVDEPTKRLWESLQDIVNSGEAWFIIQQWRNRETEKAAAKHELRATQISDGVEREWIEFENEKLDF